MPCQLLGVMLRSDLESALAERDQLVAEVQLMQAELQSEDDAAAEGEDSVVEEAAVTGAHPGTPWGLVWDASIRPLATHRKALQCLLDVLLRILQPVQAHTIDYGDCRGADPTNAREGSGIGSDCCLWAVGLFEKVCRPKTSSCITETQDLGIRELPDAQAQLIEMQLHLEEVSYNVDTIQEKVRP